MNYGHGTVRTPVLTTGRRASFALHRSPDSSRPLVHPAVFTWSGVIAFTPSLPRLLRVEVELVVENAPRAVEDQLTLTVLDETGRAVTTVTENVQTADCDHATFVIPKGGVDATPGQSYRLKLSGGTTFGWKYVLGGYEKGAATFNGRPLLPNARSTFLFRTFGAK